MEIQPAWKYKRVGFGRILNAENNWDELVKVRAKHRIIFVSFITHAQQTNLTTVRIEKFHATVCETTK